MDVLQLFVKHLGGKTIPPAIRKKHDSGLAYNSGKKITTSFQLSQKRLDS